MAHPEQKEFCDTIERRFPQYFKNVLALDIGSLDINGNNHYLFDKRCIYLGLDIATGRNVDIISPANKIGLPSETFDTIVSTECLEHDKYWAETLLNAIRMLRPGGLLLLTCATTGRAEHGTFNARPEDAPLLGLVDENWGSYYHNITEDDIRSCVDIDALFSFYEFSVNNDSHDLYFVGIKNGSYQPRIDRSISLETHPVSLSEENYNHIIKEKSELLDAVTKKFEHANNVETVNKRLIYMLRQEALRARTDGDQLKNRVELLNVELNRRLYKIARLQRSMVLKVPLLHPLSRKFYSILLPLYHKRRRLTNISALHNVSDIDNLTSFLAFLSASNGINYAFADEWYDSENPLISIIILNFNKGALTAQCLHEIWKHTFGVKYEIIVIDNGSSTDQIDALMNLSGPFRLIKLRINRLFGEGNNIAADQARGDFIILLNNDAFVTHGWINPLVEVMNDEKIGAAGPMFMYPDGIVQECGSFIDVNGDPKQRGKGLSNPLPKSQNVEDVHYISAACLLIRKDLYISLNGFSLDFEPAYYEDVDLCFRMRKLGYTVRYVQDSVVIHIENYSHREAGNVMRLGISINRDKFTSIHSDIIGLDDVPASIKDAAQKQLSRSLNGNNFSYEFINCRGKNIGIYTPFDITPGGGERFILTLASVLSMDNNVTLITPFTYSYLRLRQIGAIFNLNVSNVNMVRYDLALSLKLDVFVSMSNMIVPEVPALAPVSIHLCQFPFPIPIRQAYDQSYLLDGYNSYLSYSEFSKSHIITTSELLRTKTLPVHVIYPPCDVSIAPTHKDGKLTNIKILSVGRFFPGGHCKNYHILVPIFRKLLESADLNGLSVEYHIAGSIHANIESLEYFNEINKMAHDLPVVLHPNIDFDKLMELYKNSHIYWHGTGMSSNPAEHPEAMEHFGISIVEAMGSGCVPLAFAAGGPCEIITSGVNGFLFNTENELIEKSLFLIKNTNVLHEIADSAQTHSKKFSIQAFSESIDKLFSNLNI